jgi:protein TonB
LDFCLQLDFFNFSHLFSSEIHTIGQPSRELTMLRRAVLHRDSFRHSAGAVHDSRTSSRFSPEAPLGDLPKIVEKMTASDVDSVSRLIAQQSRLVTAATGAAIALGAGNHFFCRASAGETAPPVGVPIRSDSGLTGECIHRRVTLRCDDAEKDDRVDSAACRELQVRSIAVVPVRLGDDLAGVLEVFSNHASAFTNSHIAMLERIAELIADVCERAAQLIVAAASISGKNTQDSYANASSTTSDSAVLAESSSDEQIPETAARASEFASAALAWVRSQTAGLQRQPKLLLVSAAALVLVLASVGLIVGRRRPPSPLQQSQAVTEQVTAPTTSQALVAPPAETIETPPSTPTPAPVVANGREKTSTPKPALSSSPEPANDEVVVLKVAPGNRSPVSTPRTADTESAPPELDKISALSSASSAGILSASVATPSLAPRPAPVSQGVIAGRLIHKINPIYPASAREGRLQGNVVLSVVVQKNGKIGKVKVISGHPMLAQAAVQAVKGWLYEPFRLNGQAVDAEAQITFNFKE